jgi:phospholipid/cholesterol/gamma-HCH transport system substrate-binding protein
MIIRPKDKKNIFFSGVFLILTILLASSSIFMLSKDSSIFNKHIKLHTHVDNVQNLKLGASVQLKGIKIGTVSAIDFIAVNKIKITITIKDTYLQWIKESSHIAFRTQGVLGDKLLEILGGKDDEASLTANSYIKLKKDSQLDSFINKGEDILLVANRVLLKIDTILTNVEGEKISNILKNIDATSSKTAAMLENVEINKTMKSLKHSAKSLETISKQVQDGPGTLHSLIYDRTLHDDLRSLVGGSNRNKVLKYFIRESIKSSEN